MKKYIAFDPMNVEWDFFDTMEDAEKWIREQDWSDGFPEELMDGDYFIAKIVSRSAVKVTDKRENYPCLKNPEQHAVCSGCDTTEDECERTEEWPYDNDVEWVGDIEFVPALDKMRGEIKCQDTEKTCLN